MAKEEQKIETFCPATRQEWRTWLQKHHDKKQSVWLIQYKKNAGVATISWSEAVDEALCFGWIDSIKKSLDENRSIQFFCKRKPNGTWSKVNKAKIEQLIANGLMAPAGRATIEAARKNGSWTILDEVEELVIPTDLEAAFEAQPGSAAYFLSLSKSVRKQLLQWLVLAKRSETRQKRIDEIATHAAQKQKPKQFN